MGYSLVVSLKFDQYQLTLWLATVGEPALPIDSCQASAGVAAGPYLYVIIIMPVKRLNGLRCGGQNLRFRLAQTTIQAVMCLVCSDTSDTSWLVC